MTTNNKQSREYATTDNPNGKYKRDTVIRIENAPKKADNGLFALNASFGARCNSEAYFQWTRLSKSGHRMSTKSHNNYRSGHGYWLDNFATIVSEPEHVENELIVIIWHRFGGDIGEINLYKSSELARGREIARKWFEEHKSGDERLINKIRIRVRDEAAILAIVER